MRITPIKVTLEASEKSKEVSFSHNKGKIIAAFARVANEANLPNDIVRASLEDQSGTPLIPPMDIREWKRRSGGNFLTSAIPVNICESEMVINLKTTTAPTADIVIDFYLVHD